MAQSFNHVISATLACLRNTINRRQALRRQSRDENEARKTPTRPQNEIQASEASNGEAQAPAILETQELSIHYGDRAAVQRISLAIPEHRITSIIGPSGCGKTTLLRTLNRMNDFIPGVRISGRVVFHGMDLYDGRMDPVAIRRRIGMVFQKPNPFPKTIFQNIAWGPTIHGFRGNLQALVEESLKQSALWDEVRDRLHGNATALSGGQQQRLCIARALAMHPEIILMDEPCSALDPASTSRIEDLVFELKQRYTIVIVTHNMQQAARVSDYTAFLDSGELLEFGETRQVFTKPRKQRTADYVTGRFG